MYNQSVCEVQNRDLVTFIRKSERRLVFMAPGLTMEVARELNAAWLRLGIENVNIILDVDAEVFRLGYGEIEALTFLQSEAAKKETLISHQPGIRIGLLVVDEDVIIYSPKPMLIETFSGQKQDHPNAIRLGLPENLAKDVGLGPEGVTEQVVGMDKAHSAIIEKVEHELKINPPVKFNVAKTMIVFNSFFEFVEFELKNCFISRKEVPLNSDLFGLVKGEKAYDKLRSSFMLIDKDSKISEKEMATKKKKIADKFLIPIKGYGVIILRSKKEEFEKEIALFRKEVDEFQTKIEKELNAEIEKNKKTLMNALLPAVLRRPPERWSKYMNSSEKKQRDTEIKEMLDAELQRAFEVAKKQVNAMKVLVVYKGITYELLHDTDFFDLAKSAIPTLKTLHWEDMGVIGEKPADTNKHQQKTS
jgi:hypothetical protein